jgi:GH15 family glucan-1,4-alpha-glucosidase
MFGCPGSASYAPAQFRMEFSSNRSDDVCGIIDRAIKSAEEFGLEGPVERWRAVAAEIHDQVCRRGFDPELGSFVQSYGSKQLDASVLLLPTVGFLPADEPRMLRTLKAI